MKILFTGDYHIKLGQEKVPKDWALNRYDLFFQKIGEIEKEVDIHILGGDIFDRTPTLEELQVFWSFVKRLTIPTFIYTGNHEAETKKLSFMKRLSEASTWINDKVKIVTEIQSSADLGFSNSKFYIVPYEYIKKKETWDTLPSVPVFTHVRGEIPPHVKPEIPLEWLSKFPKVYAGDLHSHKNSQLNIVYPGSPMTTSFHRSELQGSNGYLIIDTDDWTEQWFDFGLPQLIRKTVNSKEDIVPTEYHHTIYELEGSIDKLSEKVESELLDKKIVKRQSEAKLILNETMSISDELKEYLLYVLELDDINEVMTAYHEYSSDK